MKQGDFRIEEERAEGQFLSRPRRKSVDVCSTESRQVVNKELTTGEQLLGKQVKK